MKTLDNIMQHTHDFISKHPRITLGSLVAASVLEWQAARMVYQPVAISAEYTWSSNTTNSYEANGIPITNPKTVSRWGRHEVFDENPVEGIPAVVFLPANIGEKTRDAVEYCSDLRMLQYKDPTYLGQ